VGKGLIIGIAMIALMAGIGYASINASKYNEVGSLLEIGRPSRVTVKGDVVNLGFGEYVMVYNGKTYSVLARGVYGVAEDKATGESYALFVLEGSNGYTVAALYPAGEFIARYGGSPIVDPSIVVDGIYKPDVTVKLVKPGSPPVELSVIEVNAILKGCHASYGEDQATLRR